MLQCSLLNPAVNKGNRCRQNAGSAHRAKGRRYRAIGNKLSSHGQKSARLTGATELSKFPARRSQPAEKYLGQIARPPTPPHVSRWAFAKRSTLLVVDDDTPKSNTLNERQVENSYEPSSGY